MTTTAATTTTTSRSLDIEASMIRKGDCFLWRGRYVRVSTEPVEQTRRMHFRAYDPAKRRYRDHSICMFAFVQVRL